ncbi:MarR family transcriptional regulator [Peribacillus saganii]|uniref:MarR family transcriptional regulator n=1 Tax=Peribacillus saganii TaxID=2303992 RepID=UPI00389A0CC5
MIRNPQKSPSFFADQMGISKSAISQLINKLESQQFMKRVQLTEDKRSNVLDLAENGINKRMTSFTNNLNDK